MRRTMVPDLEYTRRRRTSAGTRTRTDEVQLGRPTAAASVGIHGACEPQHRENDTSVAGAAYPTTCTADDRRDGSDATARGLWPAGRAGAHSGPEDGPNQRARGD